MPSSVNSVVIVGNLTRDPELRAIPSGTSVCELGVAVNERFKNGKSGEWEERANFFDVTVWGAQGENCAKYLSKGRPVAVQGRLRWESWETDGQRRSKIRIVADTVQFLGDGKSGGGRDDSGEGYRSGGGQSSSGSGGGYRMDTGEDDSGFQTSATPVGADDDIPF